MFKGKKNLLALFVMLSLLGTSVAHAAHASTIENSPVNVNVNGEFIQLDVHPVFDRSHLLIPIRALSSLGLSYSWDPSSKSAIIKNQDGDVVTLTQDSLLADKNGDSIPMSIPVQNREGRILVPMRFVTEAFEYNVQYETVRKMVFVTSKDYQFDMSWLEQEDLQAARKAAISLPITADFKTLGVPTRHVHNYAFLEGRADTYRFDDQYTTSIVEIKDGQAILIAQYIAGPRSTLSQTAGNIEHYGDPVMRQFYSLSLDRPVTFVRLGDGTSITGYYDGEEAKSFISPILHYSDIIQAVPGNR